MSRPESERSDWTDLDLLTRLEAAERLREEIGTTEGRLTELGTDDRAEHDLLDVRLRALRDVLASLSPVDTEETDLP